MADFKLKTTYDNLAPYTKNVYFQNKSWTIQFDDAVSPVTVEDDAVLLEQLRNDPRIEEVV